MPETSCIRPETEEFDHFTQTGEASDEFLKHLDECEDCQKVAAEVAEIQGQNLKEALQQWRMQELRNRQ